MESCFFFFKWLEMIWLHLATCCMLRSLDLGILEVGLSIRLIVDACELGAQPPQPPQPPQPGQFLPKTCSAFFVSLDYGTT